MTDQVMNEETQTNDGEVINNEGKIIDVDNPVVEQDKTDRPEWLPEKFKTGEDLAKSYSELEKILREKGKVAPEKYEIKEELSIAEDELLQSFTEKVKEVNLTNDQFNAVLEFAAENGLIGAQDFEAEMEKLGGPNSDIIKTVQSFAQAKLNPEERDVLNSMSLNAEQVKLIHKLVKATQSNGVPAKTDMVTTQSELVKEYEGLMAKYNKEGGLSIAEKQRVEEIASKIF